MREASLGLDSVLVVIPVLNEAATIAGVVSGLQALGLHHIRVVDNGSRDGTAEIAARCGADVVYEPIAGYGQACWRGLQGLPAATRWVLFCDGDGSDDLASLPEFLTHRPRCDLVLGNRTATAAGRAALTPAQHFGNRLATVLIWLGWGHRYRDLGPLRLLRRSALERLAMQDRGFGWTVEMQVRAIEERLRIRELPVAYHPRRGGKSKISGTLGGSVRAGTVILSTLGSLYLRRLAALGRWPAKG
ncbi:MAG TPA: glycosyltransferase family 2 protein [Nodosilinea sp.]|nr:glycosyltransferase family 2 protein [Nodosilinea sp.]